MKSFASWYHLEIVTEDRTKSGCLLTNPGWHYDWFGLYFWPFRSYVFIVLHVSGLKKIRIFYERCEHLGEPLVFSRQNLISIHSCSSNGDRSTKYLQKSFPFMHFFSNFATWRGSNSHQIQQKTDHGKDSLGPGLTKNRFYSLANGSPLHFEYTFIGLPNCDNGPKLRKLGPAEILVDQSK